MPDAKTQKTTKLKIQKLRLFARFNLILTIISVASMLICAATAFSRIAAYDPVAFQAHHQYITAPTYSLTDNLNYIFNAALEGLTIIIPITIIIAGLFPPTLPHQLFSPTAFLFFCFTSFIFLPLEIANIVASIIIFRKFRRHADPTLTQLAQRNLLLALTPIALATLFFILSLLTGGF